MPDPATVTWALPQLERLLPLDEESLKQILTYSDTLSPDAAADHLKNLLGDSPQALEFITNFNSRRSPAPAASLANQRQNDLSEAPKARRGGQKKRGKNIHQLPARQVEHSGNVTGAYIKREEDDYMSGKSKPRKDNSSNKEAVHDALQLQEKPDAKQRPTPQSTSTSTNPRVKPPPSAAGPLISDALPSSKNSSRNASRTASPAPKAKTKVHITGGTSMHGQSTVLNDLDSAIRALEIQTNPSLSGLTPEENAKRRCNCMATRHPLLEAAPNCLNCGKIICVKEGLGPCSFCEKPLLSQSDIQSMVRILREERGREKMEANNAAHKRAEVASNKPRHMTGAAFLSSHTSSPALSPSPATSDSETEKLKAAQAHRDKLLSFQANNAKRTKIVDEAADFDTPTSGTNMWASPQERALQLKRQQKIMREQEWAARPEYEKRRVVASIDLAGGKIVRKMAAVQRPESPVSDADVEELEEDTGPLHQPPQGKTRGGGAFSKNPLLGGLIRPIAKVDGEEGDGKGKAREREKKTLWRRVQDDNDDNEQWILDGGVYGGKTEGRVLGSEEHAFAAD
ncbi:hypothetical protein B0J12DRAFT_638941 [Macrophomina phaseolina]|uniref:TRIP4/RQT4 C2HC5-type zinc finger domain-containing protein n=1 Tax=Macrophomina phaseolina TaxID=35725 RepID=A0ABQ8GUV3_9PEZI|nr:hypothetical protein B0J12DRAFT_638941 [Macrophomina phaseolina]